MTLNYNGSKPLDLGTPPRLCYPLVIFLIRNDADETVHPDETVSMDQSKNKINIVLWLKLVLNICDVLFNVLCMKVD